MSKLSIIFLVLVAVALLVADVVNSKRLAQQEQERELAEQVALKAEEEKSNQPVVIGTLNFDPDESVLQVARKLAATNFRPVLSKLKSGYDLGKETSFVSLRDTIDSQDMTPRERQLIFGVQDGNRIGSLTEAFAQYNQFEETFGRPPADAAEILAGWWQESPELAASIGEMSLDDQYRKCRALVNPVTGRLFSGFDSSSWQPRGVNFRKLSTPEEMRAAVKGRQEAEVVDRPEVTGVVVIEVWGETKAKKLGQRPFIMQGPR